MWCNKNIESASLTYTRASKHLRGLIWHVTLQRPDSVLYLSISPEPICDLSIRVNVAAVGLYGLYVVDTLTSWWLINHLCCRQCSFICPPCIGVTICRSALVNVVSQHAYTSDIHRKLLWMTLWWQVEMDVRRIASLRAFQLDRILPKLYSK